MMHVIGMMFAATLTPDVTTGYVGVFLGTESLMASVVCTIITGRFSMDYSIMVGNVTSSPDTAKFHCS